MKDSLLHRLTFSSLLLPDPERLSFTHCSTHTFMKSWRQPSLSHGKPLPYRDAEKCLARLRLHGQLLCGSTARTGLHWARAQGLYSARGCLPSDCLLEKPFKKTLSKKPFQETLPPASVAATPPAVRHLFRGSLTCDTPGS